MHLIDSSPPVQASPHSAGWPLPLLRNEAEPSSRDATARAFTFPSFNGQDRSHPLKGRLHGFRPFTMINTLQLTRTTRLSWRFPNGRESSRAVADSGAVPVAPFACIHSHSRLSIHAERIMNHR